MTATPQHLNIRCLGGRGLAPAHTHAASGHLLAPTLSKATAHTAEQELARTWKGRILCCSRSQATASQSTTTDFTSLASSWGTLASRSGYFSSMFSLQASPAQPGLSSTPASQGCQVLKSQSQAALAACKCLEHGRMHWFCLATAWHVWPAELGVDHCGTCKSQGCSDLLRCACGKGGRPPVAGEDVHLAMLVHMDLHGQPQRQHTPSHMLVANMALCMCMRARWQQACLYAFSQSLVCRDLVEGMRPTKPPSQAPACCNVPLAGAGTGPHAELKSTGLVTAGLKTSLGTARSLVKPRQAEHSKQDLSTRSWKAKGSTWARSPSYLYSTVKGCSWYLSSTSLMPLVGLASMAFTGRPGRKLTVLPMSCAVRRALRQPAGRPAVHARGRRAALAAEQNAA